MLQCGSTLKPIHPVLNSYGSLHLWWMILLTKYLKPELLEGAIVKNWNRTVQSSHIEFWSHRIYNTDMVTWSNIDRHLSFNTLLQIIVRNIFCQWMDILLTASFHIWGRSFVNMHRRMCFQNVQNIHFSELHRRLHPAILVLRMVWF